MNLTCAMFDSKKLKKHSKSTGQPTQEHKKWLPFGELIDVLCRHFIISIIANAHAYYEGTQKYLREMAEIARGFQQKF